MATSRVKRWFSRFGKSPGAPSDAPPGAPPGAPSGAPPAASDAGPEAAPNAHNPQFRNLAQNEEEEMAYDFVKHRNVKFVGTNCCWSRMLGSIAHVIKGALGSGVLTGHVSYMKSGVVIGVIFTLLNGIYIFTSLSMLVEAAQILYRRTRIPLMSYPEIAEASIASCPNPKAHRWAKPFRYFVDIFISVDLFGACACYQIIIAKTIKQLVENVQETTLEAQPGSLDMRLYLVIMIIPFILICLIRHLKYLAPFSLFGNAVVFLCVFVTIYYSCKENPSLTGMVPATTVTGFFEFQGMNVFGMSCIGVIIPIENNMKDPSKFRIVLMIGMASITMCTFLIAFFGYAGYLDKSESPITINFPLETVPKIIKGLVAMMVFVTHGLNFWVPFMIVFHYIKKRIKKNVVRWELIFRAIFVAAIALIAIGFPSVNSLMGFIGCLCLSNMAFIWPCIINTLVIYKRPGFGKYKWRLVRNLFVGVAGVICMLFGTWFNGVDMVNTFKSSIE